MIKNKLRFLILISISLYIVLSIFNSSFAVTAQELAKKVDTLKSLVGTTQEYYNCTHCNWGGSTCFAFGIRAQNILFGTCHNCGNYNELSNSDIKSPADFRIGDKVRDFISYNGGSGHTYIIVGIDTKNNMITIMDANYNYDKKIRIKEYTYAYIKNRISAENGGKSAVIYRYPGNEVISIEDSEKPKIVNAYIDPNSVTDSSYKVYANVTDNNNVPKLVFPTWTDKDGQDDLVWYQGVLNSNGLYEATINKSNHLNLIDTKYITHIYAYDEYNNSSNTSLAGIQLGIGSIGRGTFYARLNIRNTNLSLGYDNSQTNKLVLKNKDLLDDSLIWKFEEKSNKQYLITNVKTGLVLNMEYAKDVNGSTLRINTFDNSDADYFYLESFNLGIRIIPKVTKDMKALTFNNKTNGGLITLNELGAYNNPNQSFSFEILSTPNISVNYQTHIENIGWQEMKKDGQMSGTQGKGYRIEGIKIKLDSYIPGNVIYSAHIQNIGWQNEVSNGGFAGTNGKALRIESLKIRLDGEITKYYDIYYRTYAENFGWLGWAKNGMEAGTSGYGYRLEGIEIKLVKKIDTSITVGNCFKQAPYSNVVYNSHIQNIGWQGEKENGEYSGTTGKGLRIEAIKIALDGNINGNIEYSSHVQNIGWMNYVKNGEVSGTNGKGLRIEALRIKLSGDISKTYDVYYRTYVQNFGWLGWAKNGMDAGTSRYGYRIEGIEVKLVKKNTQIEVGDSFREAPYSNVEYLTHIQNIGWTELVENGKTSGYPNKDLRLEAIKINLNGNMNGDIEYSSHVENIGWMNYVKNGNLSGTENKGYRIEAIKIRLTGDVSKKYDVYYRSFVDEYGWLGWAKNDEESGTEGLGYKIRAIEIKLVEKSLGFTGDTDNRFIMNKGIELESEEVVEQYLDSRSVDIFENVNEIKTEEVEKVEEEIVKENNILENDIEVVEDEVKFKSLDIEEENEQEEIKEEVEENQEDNKEDLDEEIANNLIIENIVETINENIIEVEN